ncbi:MAG TPA: nuclear transport factor 2 family protein [Nocardioidaceae bacterium]|nr:nuclear transport factor 2 family protein [Nocardioidaceae bacterium]
MQPHPFRVAWEARDPDAVAACFTPDGEFHSPVIGAAVIRGRHAIAELMRVVMDSTSASHFTDELREDERLVLRFHTEFNRRPVQGVVWLDLTEDDQVRELWAFTRPLTGVVAVQVAMAEGLLRRQSSILGVVTRVGLRPLVVIAGLVERIGSLVIRRLNKEQPRQLP